MRISFHVCPDSCRRSEDFPSTCHGSRLSVVLLLSSSSLYCCPLHSFFFPRCALLISRVFTLCLNHISVSSHFCPLSFPPPPSLLSDCPGVALRESRFTSHTEAVFTTRASLAFSLTLSTLPSPFHCPPELKASHTTLNLTLPSTATSSFHLVASRLLEHKVVEI